MNDNILDYRAEFANLLRNTWIPAGFDNKSKLAQYAKLNGYIRESMPKSLFRYRPPVEYTITTFTNNRISVSKPCEMGDVFDSLITVDVERVIESINNMESRKDEVTEFFFRGQQIPKSVLCHVSRGIRRSVLKNQNHIKGNIAVSLAMKHVTSLVASDLREQAKIKFDTAIDILRSTGYIACFCEKHDNLKMWSDYADRHRGFVVEYDFEALNTRFPTVDLGRKHRQPDYIVLPVVYGEQYDSTDLVLFLLMNGLVKKYADKTHYYIKLHDELWCIKGYLYKPIDYETEAEWRLITPINGTSPNTNPFSSVDAKPKAIYYGAAMNDEDIHKLDEVAIRNGVDRYRMNINTVNQSVVAKKL